jgi:outer membrane protein OmpA-like peptidoglycan-associated protein
VDGAKPEGNYPLTVTANDGRGGTAQNTITIPVMRRAPITFEDVHFDFDMSSLKPEAIRILDDAVMKLQANPTLNITIEGHCDSVGTVEYNLSPGRASRQRGSRLLAQSRYRSGTDAHGQLRRRTPIAPNDTDADAR